MNGMQPVGFGFGASVPPIGQPVPAQEDPQIFDAEDKPEANLSTDKELKEKKARVFTPIKEGVNAELKTLGVDVKVNGDDGKVVTKTASFTFNTIVFGTAAAAVEQYGEEVVTGLINEALLSKLRIKARGSLPNDEDVLARDAKIYALAQDKDKNCLVTIEEATAYTPGSREPRTPASWMKEVLKAKKDKDIVRARYCYAKYQEALAEQDKELLDGLDETPEKALVG